MILLYLPQMYNITQMFHLFNGTHLFGLLLADVLIYRKHTLANKCL